MIHLSREFDATLKLCAQHLQSTKDPWWVIGSTAVALHGVDPGAINDIDILVSDFDAAELARTWRCQDASNTASERFRSRVLLKPGFGSVPVDVMAGLEFQNLGEWRHLSPKTRQEIRRNATSLFVPERPELIEILQSFGRKKDMLRANLLS